MAFDINFRSIIAFREIGKGHEAMVRFSAVMNMPPPMSKSTFQSNLGVIYNSYLKVANGSMHKAAEKVNDNPDNAIKDVTVSVDGTWQRRRYASLNGVVTAICEGKCIDVEVLTKSCKSCQYWKRKLSEEEFLTWRSTHTCTINHKGSTGAN